MRTRVLAEGRPTASTRRQTRHVPPSTHTHTHSTHPLQVDVYSFAIILWELITRQEPYGGQKGVQIAYAAAEQGLRPEIPDYAPADYAELMQRCWAPNPDDRPEFNSILKTLFQLKKKCDMETAAALAAGVEVGASGSMHALDAMRLGLRRAPLPLDYDDGDDSGDDAFAISIPAGQPRQPPGPSAPQLKPAAAPPTAHGASAASAAPTPPVGSGGGGGGGAVGPQERKVSISGGRVAPEPRQNDVLNAAVGIAAGASSARGPPDVTSAHRAEGNAGALPALGVDSCHAPATPTQEASSAAASAGRSGAGGTAAPPATSTTTSRPPTAELGRTGSQHR